MSTKFFTNREANTLLNKFQGIFDNLPVNYFDALVGYFRSSGYYKINQHLKDVEKIRILVGIDVDHLISEAAKKGLEFNFNTDITREEFVREFKEDIQHSDYLNEVENGILQFIYDVGIGKIEIKAHPDKNIHAKIYIFRPKNWNEHNSGSVITGSSNLSENGLDKNFEFNVELRDYDDVAFAYKTFESLWQESINILPSQITEITKTTFLNTNFSPYDLYVKLLIEYFGKSIEYDPESITDLPKGYRKLAYQIDAVNDGYNKLLKHNGFILADVVGLGKTIIATIIAKKFYFANGYRTRILIIFPPALENSWRKTIRDFEVPGVEYITNGSLHQIKHPEDYDLIIVDEAHKFRSDESERFNLLQKICKTRRKRKGNDGSIQKKVILVTATPLNNKPDDIRNQLYLFQDSKKSTIDGANNLQHFFRPLIEKYNKLKSERDHHKIATGVKEIYTEIRNKIIEPIVVRRTRTDIRNTPDYWNDIVAQGVTFPNIEPPKQILYQLNSVTDELYDRTLSIVRDTKNGLGYYRYQAIKFLSEDAKKQYQKATGIDPKKADRISEQLAHIMRILLVKRIDSSFYAFKMSLSRFCKANEAMLKMIENGKIYLAPKINVNDFILDENEEELERILMKAETPDLIQVFEIEEFSEEFIEGIKKDNALLKKLNEDWNAIIDDPKYDTFLYKINNELLKANFNDNNKLLIFSESKETSKYIADRLKEDGLTKILSIDSSNQKEYAEVIAENFDANIPLVEQKNDYNIIITTEVLAEGVNLHRSNIILNYDIPWNATRLMQRIGRVNRIGTPSKHIYIYNFFPTSRTDNEIELNKKAYMKLQAFHSALGEDSQIYSTSEEYDSFGLFEKIPEEEKDERLEYLNYLRKFKDENPEDFIRIKNGIPRRARTGRKNKSAKDQTITFIKNRKKDAFYLIYSDSSVEELTFVEAARMYKAEMSERSIELHALHHNQVNRALDAFTYGEDITNLGDRASVKLGPNESRAISFIEKQAFHEFVVPEDKELIVAASTSIRRGKFQKLPREINKYIKEISLTKPSRPEAFQRIMAILKSYPLFEAFHDSKEEEKEAPKRVVKANKPEIVLSESFSI